MNKILCFNDIEETAKDYKGVTKGKPYNKAS